MDKFLTKKHSYGENFVKILMARIKRYILTTRLNCSGTANVVIVENMCISLRSVSSDGETTKL